MSSYWMFHRDDIPENDRLPSPITATVRDVEDSDQERLDSVVTIEDSAGHTIPLKIWTTHDFTLHWRVGHEYDLSGVRGSYWEGSDRYELHTTRDFSAEDRGPSATEETRLFIVGDTHVGYENRTNRNKPRWARHVDTIGAFKDALAKAASLDVDAIVHAGDIFDHGVTDRNLEDARDALVHDRERALPFYYIYGNHDWKPAKDHMRDIERRYSHIQKLTNELTSIGDPAVNLFGIDHLEGEFYDVSLRNDVESYLYPNVLVIHESPHPAANSHSARVYSDRGVDLERALADSPVEFDLIICGHMHLADRTKLEDLDIPIIVTGPTVPISKVREETPSGWLVTLSEGGLEITQQRF